MTFVKLKKKGGGLWLNIGFVLVNKVAKHCYWQWATFFVHLQHGVSFGAVLVF